jgi:hypothetical protein
MEHIVNFESGYDCIKFECINGSKKCNPGSGGSHGKHGLNIRFVVKGDGGAVQFVIYTGWMPQLKKPSTIGVRDCDWDFGEVMPADLGYHSKTPHYEGQNRMPGKCEYCDGKPCYYDGSSLNANDAMYALVNGGDNGLWKFLEEYYETVFNNAEYPKPVEYSKPLRNTKSEVE